MTLAAAENGGDLAALVTPKERRALREKARRLVLAEERERIEAARAQAGDEGPPPPSSPPARAPDATPSAPAPSPAPTDDETLAADLAPFLRGVVFPVLAFLSLFTPWRLDLAAFDDAAAREDAAAWVPLVRQYPRLAWVVRFTSGPARLLARLDKLKVPRSPTSRGGAA